MYLGIDVGTSTVKTVLIDERQRCFATASAPLGISRPQSAWSEQNPEDWWTATCHTISEIQSAHPKALQALKGIGLSGQMHGATLLDKDHHVIRPAILWNDGRSGKECQELEASCPESRNIAGNIAMAGFTAPKLLWLRKFEPENFDRIAKILLPKDYIRFRLTGEFASDMSDSAGTLWLDVAQRRWSDTLLQACGLHQAQMPALVEGTEISAYLKPALQQQWGIAEKVPVAGGGGDNAASACGMGIISAGDAFISLGTSGVIFAGNDSFLPNTGKAVHAFCHALPHSWHQMGVILSATDSLEWLSRITGQSVPAMSAALGDNIQPSELLFLPYLSGERTPHNDPSARGAFIGLSQTSDIQALMLAVMEGVAFALRDNQEALQATGTDFDAALVVGGGAKSITWLKIIATVLNRPLKIPQNSEVGAAFGAARLGICASHNASTKEICYQPEIKQTIYPEQALVSRYQEKYQQFQKLYPAIRYSLL